MIADTIFRTIGHERLGVPGTWRAGADSVRQILRQKAGINLGNTILVDGSGLSRHNLISPATMMQVLQYIAQNDQQLNIISMLPLAGHDGTLQYRGGLHEAGVDGKVSAKTGSLQGYIIWLVLSLRLAGSEWRLFNIFLDMRFRHRIKKSVVLHWFVSKAGFIETYTKIINLSNSTGHTERIE